MSYSIKEVFLTLQGEGFHAGKTAIFVRFSGCNLWNGKEKDRQTAQCNFCDTDFIGTNGLGGGKFENAQALVTHCDSFWKGSEEHKFCVLTGGEPLLQLDKSLIDAFHNAGYTIAIETNGTIDRPEGIDWICVSPKINTPLKVNTGDELKFIYPQKYLQPELFENMSFNHFSLQPMDNAYYKENLSLAIDYCLTHPQWRLSLQTHKIMNIR